MSSLLASTTAALFALSAQPKTLPLPAAPPGMPPPPVTPSVWLALAQAAAPLVAFVFILPIVWWFFRKTWRELDVEAFEHQRERLARGESDARPLVLFVITAVVLTLQWYFDRDFYLGYVKPFLQRVEQDPSLLPLGLGARVSMRQYGELYALSWWAFTRVAGYTVFPFAVWKICFPKDSLLDMGLRTKGLLGHAWIYLLCLAVVVPAVFIVASGPDFGQYYPFYRRASRSWLDFAAWEAMYVAQFFGLEVFFRGFWLNGLRRSMGSTAIFAMVVPYCMIHFGKPYLETCGAIVAGIALGSLAMRTKSIYSGFLVHVTIALLMDFLALSHRGGLPTELYPPRPAPPTALDRALR